MFFFSGNICSVSNSYLRFKKPNSFFAAMSFGNCGYAFPCAMGAKVIFFITIFAFSQTMVPKIQLLARDFCYCWMLIHYYLLMLVARVFASIVLVMPCPAIFKKYILGQYF